MIERARGAVTRSVLGLALALVAPVAIADNSSGSAATSERVPESYERVVLRLGAGKGPLFRNALYEGNNMAMRYPAHTANGTGTGTPSGAEVARRWRTATAACGPIFVLRDALFSQPDHPVDQRPQALMLPPNWVTAAAAEVASGRLPAALALPPLEDDAAWLAIPSAAALFGIFPVSERLYEQAHANRSTASPAERARIENARASLASLAADANALIAAAPRGVRAVAEAGAERIARSDIEYFGVDGRKSIIPIAVEHPNRHELEEEAKGVEIAQRAVANDVVDQVRNAIYSRRLRDGDLAIERYDISLDSERTRAIHVLEALIPRQGNPAGGAATAPNTTVDSNNKIWLWVNGGLDAAGIGGRDATAFVPIFRKKLAQSNVDVSRLRLFSKPHVRFSGKVQRAAFDSALTRYRALDLPMSVNFDGSTLLHLLKEPTEAR